MDAPPIPPVLEETQWRRRRRRQDTDGVDDTDDDARSVVSLGSQWQPDAADVEMMHSLTLVEALPVDRLRLGGSRPMSGRRVKRMKVDLADMSMGPLRTSSSSANDGGLFTDMHFIAPADEHTGNALLCFLSADTFVGFVELQANGQRHVLKLNGSESLTECDRALCAVQDCCGDKAFLVTAQSAHGRRKRSFLARSAGVGDYFAFEGRGMRFVTEFVPGDEQREQVLSRHFGMLPRAVRRESVLCLGQMNLHWRGLGAEAKDETEASVAAAASLVAAKEEHEGYAGDKSEAGSSGDEHDASVRSAARGILPMLSSVVIPQPRSFSISELVARGGTPVETGHATSMSGGAAEMARAADEEWL